MEQHPAESRVEPQLGIVTKVYPETWEVDVQLLHVSSSTVRRAKVTGPFLPEVHTQARPSHVVVKWLDAYQQSPVAQPLHNTIVPESERRDHVYWSEHMGFRIKIKEPGHQGKGVSGPVGELEIRNAKGPLLQIRIIEDGGVIRIDTPTTHFVQNNDAGSIEVSCDGDLTATAGGDATVVAAGSMTLTAPTVTINGAVTINGSLDVL